METDPERKKLSNVEFAIFIALITILLVLFIRPTIQMFTKSRETAILANLGEMRSAISVYYSENQQYPLDDLSVLTTHNKYLSATPHIKSDPSHPASTRVLTETLVTDSGNWSYDNNPQSPTWGTLRIGCTHTDSKGVIWSTY